MSRKKAPSALALNEEDLMALVREEHDKLAHLCLHPAPVGMEEAARTALSEAATDFVDRLMARACAHAAFRYKCTTLKELKRHKVALTTEDVEMAWLSLQQD